MFSRHRQWCYGFNMQRTDPHDVASNKENSTERASICFDWKDVKNKIKYIPSTGTSRCRVLIVPTVRIWTINCGRTFSTYVSHITNENLKTRILHKKESKCKLFERITSSFGQASECSKFAFIKRRHSSRIFVHCCYFLWVGWYSMGVLYLFDHICERFLILCIIENSLVAQMNPKAEKLRLVVLNGTMWTLLRSD